jgi:RNA polymerase sigma-70 factor, ECF subfamily
MQESGSPVLLEHLFRRESGRIVAWLTGLLGSTYLQLAEDAAQEAMLRAAQTWPFEGIPQKPEAWLFRCAHNYAISSVRRSAVFSSKADALVVVLETATQPILDLDIELSLKLVGGFSKEEIARIFFSEPSTIAQRLVRAKRLIRDQKLALTMPSKGQLKQRLNSVLQVIYLMFSGGYAAHAGEDLTRVDVCQEALRLGRLVASSSMGAPRVDALVALMALQAARLPARMDAAGDLVLLEEQDRKLWDENMIALGFSYFDRSIAGDDISEWHIQAAIAATYASAACSAEINWASILQHYDLLMEMTNSPVVSLNRAVVVMKVHGAEASLAALTPLAANDALQKYHLLRATQGHVLAALGRLDEARAAFSAALECDCTLPEKRFLQRQLAMLSVQRHSQ